MSTNDLVMKVEQLKELEELLEEVKAEAESVRDEIKQEMMAQDTEELEAGQYIIRRPKPQTRSLTPTHNGAGMVSILCPLLEIKEEKT